MAGGDEGGEHSTLVSRHMCGPQELDLSVVATMPLLTAGLERPSLVTTPPKKSELPKSHGPAVSLSKFYLIKSDCWKLWYLL